MPNAQTPAGIGQSNPSNRDVQCYFSFAAPREPAGDDRTEFFWLYMAAKLWRNGSLLKVAERDLARTVAKKQELYHGKVPELRRLAQLVEAATANGAEVTVDNFLRDHGEELKRMGIEGALEHFVRNRNAKVETARMEEMADAEEQALRCIGTLSDGLHEKRQDAAEYLLRLGLRITLILQAFYRTNPELFRQATSHSVQLPVIASLDPGWVAAAEGYLQAVGIGKLRADGQFSRTAYQGEVYVCREWAAKLVQCIDMNRRVLAMRELIGEYLEGTAPDKRVPLGTNSGSWKEIRLEEPPAWVATAAALPDFRKATAGAWAKVARQVLRIEVPDLNERTEFAALVQSIKGRYRDAPGKASPQRGRITNALLDKICEAIETIAREDARNA